MREPADISARSDALLQEYLREERAYRDGLRRRVEENPPPIPPWPCPSFADMRQAVVGLVEEQGLEVMSWTGRAVDYELGQVGYNDWRSVYPDQSYRCDIALPTLNVGAGLVDVEYDPAFGIISIEQTAGF